MHDYIIENCVYTDNAAHSVNTAYGALCLGTATCEGYSRAFQLVMSMLDIDNMLATGKAADSEGEIQGHMWNIVKIEDAWYYTDLTWDDPVSDEHVTGHSYFNVPGSMIANTHSEIEPAQIQCTALDNNYFVRNKLYFDSASLEFETRFLAAVARTRSSGQSSVEVMFSDEYVYEQAKRKMLDEGLVRTAFELSSIIRKNQSFTMNYSENQQMNTFRLFLK